MPGIDALLILIERDGARAATVDRGVVLDLARDTGDGRDRPGAIHLGRILREDRGLGASFVDIGTGEPGLLDMPGGGPPVGKAVLVQVVQGPSEGKGPRLSMRLRLLGPNLALTSQSGRVKDGDGVEGRPLGRSDPAELLAAERAALVAAHQGLLDARQHRAPVVPLLYEPDPATRLVQTFAVLDPRRILVSDRLAAERIRRRLAGPYAALAARIEAAEDGSALFDRPEVDGALIEAESRVLTLPGGGRITIDAARAATLVDVDTAGAAGAPGLFARVNAEAAVAVGRQIRLRDCTGVIVVDFIGADRHAWRTLDSAIHRGRGADPRPVEILGFTRAGLYEIVRSGVWL